MATEFSYDVKDRMTIESKGNFVTCLGNVSWNGGPHKLELRRWIIKGDEVVPQRGVTFSTEEGPHNLTEALVKMGYGNTAKLAVMLTEREDYASSTANVGEEEAEIDTSNDMYSIGDLLNSISK